MSKLRVVPQPEEENASQPKRRALVADEDLLIDAIAEATRAVGQDDFYVALLNLVGRTVDCNRRLVVRYRKYARPALLINQSLTHESQERYLAGLYRLDPLLRVVSSGAPPAVLSLNQVAAESEDSATYIELFRFEHLRDEIAMMLPEYGGAYIALCFDHERREFDARDRTRMRRLYAIADALHRLHIERRLANVVSLAAGTPARPMLVADAQGHELYRSHSWKGVDAAALERLIHSTSTNGSPSAQLQFEDRILYCQKLGDEHPVAPGGFICFQETHSPGYLEHDAGATLASFAKTHRLSPREREIVQLTLRGYPTSGIAKRLNLTVGTVKNYKHRLYDKLDITSEREVFSTFIEHLFGQDC